MVKRELINRHDIHAVAIYRQRYRNCRLCSLQYSSKNISKNKAFAEITEAIVNKGAG